MAGVGIGGCGRENEAWYCPAADGDIAVTSVIGARTASAARPTANVYAIDADSGTPGVQGSVIVPVGSTFTFATVITDVADPYQAHQVNVKFDTGVVQYKSGPVEHPLGGAVICAGGSIGDNRDTLYDGCTRQSGTQSDTGATFEWTLTCVKDGSSALHLMTEAEIVVAVATNFAIESEDNDVIGDPVTRDATVTCGNAPTPTATAPGTPTGPTPANTVPAEVPTSNPTEIIEAKTPGSAAQATVTARVSDATRTAADSSRAQTVVVGIAGTSTAQSAAETGPGATMTAEAASVSSNGSGGSSHKGLIIGLVIAGVAWWRRQVAAPGTGCAGRQGRRRERITPCEARWAAARLSVCSDGENWRASRCVMLCGR